MQKKNLKFNICGSSKRSFPGYINVDIKPFADIQADIRKPLPIDNECAIEVFSCATLEHFKIEDVKSILKEFYRILQPKGKLVIAVPDLEEIFNCYVNNEITFEWFTKYLYGGQADEYDYHRILFDYTNLRTLLNNVGFVEVLKVEYDLPFYHKKYMMKVICKKL